MSKILTATLLVGTVSILGCSKDSSPPASAVPPQLNQDTYQQMKKTTPLAPETRTALAGYLKNVGSKLPSPDMVFGTSAYSSTMSSSGVTGDTSSLDADGKANFQKIKNSCRVNAPNSSHTGSGKPGQAFSFSTVSSISGGACPIAYSNSTSFQGIVLSNDESTGAINANMSGHFDFSFAVLDADMKKQAQTSTINLNLEGTAILENYVNSGNGGVASGGEHMTAKITGALVTDEGVKVSINGTGEAILRKGQSDMQFLVTVSTPKGDLTIGTVIHNGTHEVYLNGQPISDEQLKTEFGVTNFGT